MKINGINLLVTAPGEIQLLESCDLMGGMRRELRELTRISDGPDWRATSWIKHDLVAGECGVDSRGGGTGGPLGAKLQASNIQPPEKYQAPRFNCSRAMCDGAGAQQRLRPDVFRSDSKGHSNQFQTLFQRIPKLIPNVFTRISSRFHRYSMMFNDFA